MFASDNCVGAAPEIVEAICAAAAADNTPYGGDRLTQKAIDRIKEVFECDAEVFFVPTGGAANGLALSVLTPPYGTVFCHEAAHVEMDECAGPEFFTGGAKLTLVRAPDGKVTTETLQAAMDAYRHRPPHGSPPSALSITQLTECGTVYSLGELSSLSQFARQRGLRVHMDGARFANALVATGASPADMTWRSGVDILTLGATKNGCLMAEAIIVFDNSLGEDLAFRRKRAGHLVSKQSFIPAQFLAWLEEDRWLQFAEHANDMAKRLSAGLAEIHGVTISYPTHGNEVFAIMPEAVAQALRTEGFAFYPWVTPGDPADGRMHRLICSYKTEPETIDRFLSAARHNANGL